MIGLEMMDKMTTNKLNNLFGQSNRVLLFLKREQPIFDDLGVKHSGRVNLQRDSKEAVFLKPTNYR
jgi:hypothetical protein